MKNSHNHNLEEIKKLANNLELIPCAEAFDLIIKLATNQLRYEAIGQLREYFHNEIQHLGTEELKINFLLELDKKTLKNFVNGCKLVGLVPEKFQSEI